jgi:hypothetical protein
MYDKEIERLRRLRATALRVRTVARALDPRDALLNRGRCAAWRVARAVSGRLRAHPYASFQRDAGIGVMVSNGLAAANAAMGVKTRHQGLLRFEAQLRSLARELADVRALTAAPDLNESFGRSQIEIRALLAAVAHEVGAVRAPPEASVSRVPNATTVDSDWPFLAF